ncbi:dihydroneopterin triphosphate 2'-epimerase [Wenzhouxiangella sp. XN79A]|uniref:dihydroneopterin triphosphate 2'-epimerase n=1 Tax=Wenzhouxiangella sp. XN79A TaxID=2724193 RepID=UPI00144AF943|nr:dihydroneopterin triphosphate 2'-epimerase [Wenzhouxiangella sp. XN79A]NKI34192.1 dihydroneopterin triphosphate 2'-epimerase [Wenzhouxiangella sp. XN79A]
MTKNLATIRIHNLRLRTLIGFNADERVKKQDIVINAEIAYTLADGVFEDRVEDALNYKTITKAIIEHVEEGQFLLLEKLVGDVLAICSKDKSVQRASVTIEKPHALRFADSVSLTLDYHAQHAALPRLLEKAS